MKNERLFEIARELGGVPRPKCRHRLGSYECRLYVGHEGPHHAGVDWDHPNEAEGWTVGALPGDPTFDELVFESGF